jgi:hypothetical protein
MSHDFHLFSHETSVNMVLSMCQSHIFSGWNFEKKSQKNKKNIASDTFKNTYFAPFWKTNPDLVKICQDKKTFSQLWHRWKPSLICGIVGSVQVFWRFVSHWVVGFPGHYTTPHQTSWPQCGNNHMHDFTYSCSCFAQEFECSATEPQKKPNVMFSKQGVEFAPGVILRQWKLFTSCRLLLTIWQQFFIFWKI